MAENEVELVEEPEVTEEVVEEVTEGEKPEGITVQIGDEESPPQDTEAPEWVKKLRHQYREEKRARMELERKLQAQGETQEVKLPPRPTLEAHNYDEAEFQTAIDGWYAKKAEFDAQTRAKQKQAEDAQKHVETVRTAYQEKATALGAADYKEVEEDVVNTLSETQQGLILSGAENPALLIYALGKNPQRLAALSQITDPVKFAFAAAKLEKDLKVSNRKPEKPSPDTPLRSSGSVTTNGRLDALRAEAEKTGDYTKVRLYKQTLKK